MIPTVFRGADHPAADRFDQWYEMAATSLLATRISVDDPQAFDGDVRAADLGAVQVTGFRHSPGVARREPVQVRRDDRQTLQIVTMLQGSAVVEHNRTQAKMSAGDMVMHGAWHPFVGYAFAAAGSATVSTLALNILRHAIPVAAARVDQLLGRPLRAQGTAAILVRFLKDLFTPDPGTRLRPREAEHLGNATLALTAAMLARLADTETTLSPEVRRTELVARVRAFIDRHLGNPDLSPATLAAAHHISVRQLHRVFQEEGTTASALVRRRRLERCRHDLAANLNPVHEIAARWGFTDAAHFSRVFRATYGHSPLDHRHRHAWHASSTVVAPTVNDGEV